MTDAELILQRDAALAIVDELERVARDKQDKLVVLRATWDDVCVDLRLLTERVERALQALE